jgi:flagellar export protein FliJ
LKNFRFSLERVLSWRRTELEREEASLAPLLAERSRLETAGQRILADLARAGRELVAAGPVDGSDLSALAGYRARLEKERTANERDRAGSTESIALQRARVTEAHRRFRLLEKLRGRRLEEWRAGWNREMESLASEAFLARWHGRARKRPDACGPA